MFLSLRDLRAEIVVTQPGQTWEPAGTCELISFNEIFSRRKLSFQPDGNLVRPAVGSGHFALNGLEVEQLVVEDIEKLGLLYQTVDNLLVGPEILNNTNWPLSPSESQFSPGKFQRSDPKWRGSRHSSCQGNTG